MEGQPMLNDLETRNHKGQPMVFAKMMIDVIAVKSVADKLFANSVSK